MSKTPQNPFENDNWFSELVQSNDAISKTSQRDFKIFLLKNDVNPMNSFQKIILFYATHTISAILTASICLGGIATFATQAVAPEQYRPSTIINNLFKNNKVQITNPNIPLVADNEYDLVGYDPCNVAIKYPKYINNERLTTTNMPNGIIPASDKFNNMAIMSQNAFDYQNTSLNSFYLSCISLPDYKIIADEEINKAKLDQGYVPNEFDYSITLSELSELTGWFAVGDIDIKNVLLNELDTRGGFLAVWFEYGELKYKVTFVPKNIPQSIRNRVSVESLQMWETAKNKPGIFGDQIQIQFKIPDRNVVKSK